jgi:hypothetical protein
MDSSTGSAPSFEPPKNQIEYLELLEGGTLRSNKLRIHIAYMNGQCAQLQSRMREIVKGNKQLTEAFNVLRTITTKLF